MIFIVVKHPVRAEYADDWLSLVGEFTSATRAEPGNLSFDWFRSVELRLKESSQHRLVELRVGDRSALRREFSSRGSFAVAS